MTASPRTYALVKAFGANVVEVLAWPREQIGAVGVALTAAGYEWTPAGMNEDSGVAAALLIFNEQDFGPGDLAPYVDALAEAGIHTFGYELFHDHEFSDFDAWSRVGRIPSSDPSAPVFAKVFPGDEEWSTAHVALLGDAAVLDKMWEHVSAEADTADKAQGPGGTCSVMMHYERDDVVERIWHIADVAVREGVDLHHPW
ncbi:hypothetical protein JK386_09495 [Nocardioides sp. zg-536]|uniref:Uncharacterized protein n=1 Tax=Nocardioides faecalis TaxID=2803858 RepID=A0A939BW25_9ACTN|nr:hypothetical protein [Nocardioides faecalis]MBM9460137.1 hypothetical protein [Nocardioides faecalis]QVI60068.1 hypothetical protein KG111_07110 [Nocardioides faecalis]